MPKRTLRLLTELKMEQKYFQEIHHFKQNASIGVHRSYCERVQSFRPESPNIDIRNRLEVVKDVRRAGGDWNSAITEALRRFPFR